MQWLKPIGCGRSKGCHGNIGLFNGGELCGDTVITFTHSLWTGVNTGSRGRTGVRDRRRQGGAPTCWTRVEGHALKRAGSRMPS